MRPARFWTGVLVGLAAFLGSAVPARAQEPADECCALPGPAPVAAGWWQRFLVVQRAEVGQQPGTITHAYKCVHVPAGEAQRMLVQLLGGDGQKGAKGGRLALVADERTNTLFVRASAERVTEVEALLNKIDVPVRKGPVAGSAPYLSFYPVPDGQADPVAKLLQKIYERSSGAVVIQAVSPSKIAMFADPNTHLAVARDLHQAFPPAVAEVIPLTVLQAAQTAALLGGRQKEPLIEVDSARNALLVKGTREQINEVREALRALGEPGTAAGAKVQILTIPTANAADLADHLKRTLEKMRGNPVRLILPGKVEARPAKGGAPPAKQDAKLPGKPNVPVTITAAGDKLVLSSDDPEALALAKELVRLANRAPGQGDFEVIRLRHANAAAIAQTLDEIFNGPRAGEGKAFPGTKGGPPRRENRVRIVPEPVTNTLLVRASPLDLMTIRRLLERSLDSVDAALSESQMRTWVLGSLKYAKAAELAKVVQEVYRAESTRSADAARSRPALTVGVDEKANTLVLRCSQPLYEEIRRLVEQLEQLHRDRK